MRWVVKLGAFFVFVWLGWLLCLCFCPLNFGDFGTKNGQKVCYLETVKIGNFYNSLTDGQLG